MMKRDKIMPMWPSIGSLNSGKTKYIKIYKGTKMKYVKIANTLTAFSAGNYCRTSDIVRLKCCKCPTNIAICSDIMSEHFDLALVLDGFFTPLS